MTEDLFGIVGTTQAGQFQVLRVVAEGGFGVVYQAMHLGFKAPVALKCLKMPDDKEYPEIVRPLHIDVLHLGERTVPFLALEWLEGQSLESYLDQRKKQGKKLPGLKPVINLLEPVAKALTIAHHFPTQSGTICVVHRDIKPDNIFLVADEHGYKVKILDFGIAKAKSIATNAVGKETSGGGLSAFTPGYAAPEQWIPKRFGQTGPWTDVWSFALTMVEALCGHSPIDGDITAMMGTALDETRRPTPRNEGVELPLEIDAIFERAMAINPQDRYQEIEHFWNDLMIAVRTCEEKATNSLELEWLAKDKRITINRSSLSHKQHSHSSNNPQKKNDSLHEGLHATPRTGPVSRKRITPIEEMVSDINNEGISFENLKRPLFMIGVSICLAVFDVVSASRTGEILELGWFRLAWVTAPTAIIGTIWLGVCIFQDRK